MFDDREDGVAKRVLQSRPPRVVELLERRHDPRSHLVYQRFIAAGERVEGHSELSIAGIEENHVVGAVTGHEPQNRIRQVAVGVNQPDAVPLSNIAMNLIEIGRASCRERVYVLV